MQIVLQKCRTQSVWAIPLRQNVGSSAYQWPCIITIHFKRSMRGVVLFCSDENLFLPLPLFKWGFLFYVVFKRSCMLLKHTQRENLYCKAYLSMFWLWLWSPKPTFENLVLVCVKHSWQGKDNHHNHQPMIRANSVGGCRNT